MPDRMPQRLSKYMPERISVYVYIYMYTYSYKYTRYIQCGVSETMSE